ncbi:MAG: hypothetical protein KGJ01_00465, partial [Patescibacteria group bacterium]|nr:hypothetical protein [Patescibacteria group bacterium]
MEEGQRGGFAGVILIIIVIGAIAAGIVGWNVVRRHQVSIHSTGNYAGETQSNAIGGRSYTRLYVGQSAVYQPFTIKLTGVPSTNSGFAANLDITDNNAFSRSIGQYQYSALGPSIYLIVDQVSATSDPAWASINISSQVPDGFTDAGVGGNQNISAGSNSTNRPGPVVKSNTDSSVAKNSTTSSASSNEKPVLVNLGVRFGPWNKSTNQAGDFVFRHINWSNKIMAEFGAQVYTGTGTTKILPHFTYVVTSSTPVMAPTDLVMVFVSWQSDTQDYEIQGHPVGADG